MVETGASKIGLRYKNGVLAEVLALNTRRLTGKAISTCVLKRSISPANSLWPARAADNAGIPIFSPASNIGWQLADDEFLQPENGPGPVVSDPAHPLAEDLRRKDFTLIARWPQAAALRPDFLKRYVAFCRAAARRRAAKAAATPTPMSASVPGSGTAF